MCAFLRKGYLRLGYRRPIRLGKSTLPSQGYKRSRQNFHLRPKNKKRDPSLDKRAFEHVQFHLESCQSIVANLQLIDRSVKTKKVDAKAAKGDQYYYNIIVT